MAKTLRTVRRVKRKRPSGFDEQVWPVNLALVVLGAFLIGVVLAFLRFDDARWWANAWTHLLGAILLIAGWMVGANYISNRTIKRSMQFSAAISFAVHALLVIGMLIISVRAGIEAMAMTKDKGDVRKRDDNPRAIFQITPKAQQSDARRPIDPRNQTLIPPPEVTPPPETRTAPDSPSPTAKPENEPTQPAITAPVTAQTKKAEAVETAPRRADSLSKLSRQPSPALPIPATSPTAQPQKPVVTEKPSKPEAKSSQVARLPAGAPGPARPAFNEPGAPSPQSGALARRGEDRAPAASITATPSTPRKSSGTQIAATGTQAAAAGTAASPGSPAASGPKPGNVAATKVTASGGGAKTPASPSPDRPQVASGTSQTRQQLADAGPRQASTPQPAPGRRAPVAAPQANSVVADAPSRAPGTGASPATNLTAQATGVGRQAGPSSAAGAGPGSGRTAEVAGGPGATPGPAGGGSGGAPTRLPRGEAGPALAQSPQGGLPGRSSARNRNESTLNLLAEAAGAGPSGAPGSGSGPSPLPAASSVTRQTTSSPPTARAGGTTSRQPREGAATGSPSAQIARAGGTGSAPGSVPTLNPRGPAGGSPSRASKVGGVEGSPHPIDTPSLAGTGTGGSNPGAEPSHLAFSRGTGGTAGSGRGPNLDRAGPAASGTGTVASGSMARASASQQGPPGPALAPSAPASVARGQSGGQVASSSLRADNADYATVGGAGAGGEVTASSSAAAARGDSNAPAGNITAGVGNSDVDLGPTQVVAEAGGTSRGSGGGQPVLNASSNAPTLARRDAGGAPAASLGTTKVAAVAEAPAGTGGGTPQSFEASPQGTAAVRSEAGGTAALSGGPTLEAPIGPVGGANVGDSVTRNHISRAASGEALVGNAQAGGGGGPGAEGAHATNIGRAANAGGPATTALAADLPGGPGAASGGSGGAPGSALQAAATGAERSSGGGGSGAGGGMTGVEVVGTGGAASAELLGSTQLGRANGIDALPGPAVGGGGTGSPARISTGPDFAALTKADVPALPGTAAAVASTKTGDGGGMQAQDMGMNRTEGAGAAGGGPAAGTATDVAANNAAGVESGGMNRHTAEGGTELALANFDGKGPGSLSKRGAAPGIATGLAVEVPPGMTAVSGSSDPKSDASAVANGTLEVGPTARQASGNIAVAMNAPPGPGGVGEEFALDTGLASRKAQLESQEVNMGESRFVRSDTSGLPSVNLNATVSADAFRERGQRKGKGLKEGGGASTKTEDMVEQGLVFLAKHQSADGHWSLHEFSAGHPGYENESLPKLRSDTAATGLSLLAFLGAGYHHQEVQFRSNTSSGIEWLIKHQKPDGDLFVPMDAESNKSVWLYSHGIATLALCEAYGMTGDPKLKEPAQKAINFIIAAQDPELGAWRYEPRQFNDTSVSGWMVMALRSGELAGLKVDKKAYKLVERWLDRAQGPGGQKHLYRYNPDAADSVAHGRDITPTMTSVGLLMRLYTGWRRDNENMVKGGNAILEHLPSEREQDTYYWYYATQVMFHMQGKQWEQWNNRLHPLLVELQIKDGPLAGSWEPKNDRWGEYAGRLYVTTMNLLSLEVYYRHLPLYEETAK